MPKLIVMIVHHNLKRAYVYRIPVQALLTLRYTIYTFEGNINDLYDSVFNSGIPMHLASFLITNSDCLSEIYEDVATGTVVHVGSTTLSIATTLAQNITLCEMDDLYKDFKVQDYTIPATFDDAEAVEFITQTNDMVNDQRLTHWIEQQSITHNYHDLHKSLKQCQVLLAPIKDWCTRPDKQ